MRKPCAATPDRNRAWPGCGFFIAAIVLLILVVTLGRPAHAAGCSGILGEQGLVTGGEQPDLLIDKPCRVVEDRQDKQMKKYWFRHVKIVNGGILKFEEPPNAWSGQGQDFWAQSIIIENGGQLLAGVDDQKPYGTLGKTLTFHLYGPDPRGNDPTKTEGPGVSCSAAKPGFADCGIPKADVWDKSGTEITFPSGVKDYFYQYSNLHGGQGTDPDTKQEGHFGYKVLGMGYGGTLRLRGLKGTTQTKDSDITTMLKAPEALTKAEEAVVTNSGSSWARLKKFDKTGVLELDRNVAGDWRPGDEIVVTTTDYFPDHSEVRVLGARGEQDAKNLIKVTKGFDYNHSDKQYDVKGKLGDTDSSFRQAIKKADGDESFLQTAETRAAVALLTRSIRIVSGGDKVNTDFPANATYGGHVVFRAGFTKLQIQGVEFKQLGQGGLLGRYPVHFHMARRVPADTYVVDSSINESMTRWVVLHSTLGVTVARNVGFKSIGHGFFLEDATETDNKFYSNIGISVRAAVVSAENSRGIPGLLEAANYSTGRALKYNSDSAYPTAFWMTNGWNALAGNMAVGAGTCGACYWYVSAGNHDMVETDMMKSMNWSGYSLIQASRDGSTSATRAGRSPIRLFYKNYCSTAMHALSITDGSPCTAVQEGRIERIINPRNKELRAPDDGDETKELMKSKMYFPRYGGNRNPTKCDPTLAKGTLGSCYDGDGDCAFGDPQRCVPSVFSHLTSSFTWAQTNFSSIWLRSGYILLDHNFLSDIQGPGVTFVTGGDYRRANLPLGYWGLVSNSIFVGTTRPDPFAGVEKGKLPCTVGANSCIYKSAGVAYPLAAFGAGQRMYNVYDGPAYEDANAYLDIRPFKCTSLDTCIYYNTLGVRRAQSTFAGLTEKDGYLPNAAIGWKQSNGFYYPPAFRSRNLFFKSVDIRHYVVEPLTFPGTYRTNIPEVAKQYVLPPGNTDFFKNWSDVDRQTELSDDDGSLTGFKQSISVNEDSFFRAPSQTAQCRSNVGVDPSNACAGQTPKNSVTARTSPYDHITTALYSKDDRGGPEANWGNECSNQECTGVPIYRQYLTGLKGTAGTSTREWLTWMTNKCDDQYKKVFGQTRTIPEYDWYKYPPPVGPRKMTDIETFETQCPSPFVRMAGMGFGQRSVLTVNNGRYFIDTTQSADYQRKTKELEPTGVRWVSLFQPNKTYYVYFLFAKKTTRQTYQIYGGSSFKPEMISGVRVNISSWTDAGSFTDWPAFPWKAVPDPETPGVVNVEVDFSKIDPKYGNLDPADVASGDTCHPSTYCKKVTSGTKTTCGCDESKLGPLALLNPNYKNVCKNVCEHWAVQDIDCPKEGCFGFKFTLPSDFKADDTFHRPKPIAYPMDENSIWKTLSLQRTTTSPDDAKNKGDCYYPNVPSDDAGSTCKVAD